jgi:serine/threonine protein phosphatase PrpC
VNHKQTPEEMAVALVQQSLFKSKDNISVIVEKINLHDPMLHYHVICDGHGGDEVSNLIYHHFDDVFTNLLQKSK